MQPTRPMPRASLQHLAPPRRDDPWLSRFAQITMLSCTHLSVHSLPHSIACTDRKHYALLTSVLPLCTAGQLPPGCCTLFSTKRIPVRVTFDRF